MESCSHSGIKEQKDSSRKIVNIILDTDIGSDCDDAGALAVLHRYADMEIVNILGVIFSSGKNRYGSGVCVAINAWYGRTHLPLGQYSENDVGDPKDTFSQQIATDTARYHHKVVDSSDDMISVYKQILKQQPDKSVTIVTIGHPHGLVHLMNDAEGMRLIQDKVEKCISMAYAGNIPHRDWNFGRNGAELYISDFLNRWPVDIYFSSAGTDVLTGHKLLPQAPNHNPVKEIYRLYNNALQNGRSSWDQIAVLFAVQPDLFVIDSIGSLVQNTNYETYWNVEYNRPNHKRVNPIVSKNELEIIIESMMAELPLK
jgi:inosine-uridine nucleoside N-ribohydrolase